MEDQILEQISGCVEEITFRNDQNGYTVCKLETEDEWITVVGCLPTINVGDRLKLGGVWQNHATYGRQFRATVCEQTRPATSEAILKYLSSGAVKGIGPTTACRIVELFGEDTLEVMEKEPYRLSQVKGISHAKALKIGAEYARLFGIREVMLRLTPYGFSPEESLQVYRALGANAVERVMENPYVLCSPKLGFSFDRADVIAEKLHIQEDSPARVENGVLHVLRHNTSNGHTCLPRSKLVATAKTMLAVQQDAVEIACDMLVAQERLVLWIDQGVEYLFLPWLWRAESYAASRMMMMLEFPPAPCMALDSEIDAIQQELGIRYEALQREAIHAALEKGLLILTGGPGTGKTTTLRAIIDIMAKQGMRIAMAAPTGRAAKRMADLTGAEAKTIHRLLEVAWSDSDHLEFNRNENNPLECDAVIVDELSMVDAGLFESLLRALPLGCRLILVGDPDQLPSVGPGNVLGDLLASGKLPHVRLKEIFRQSMKSLIVTNAHRIVTGQMPDLSRRDGDFFLLDEPNPHRAAQLLCDLCVERLPAAYGFDPLRDIQLLCPSRKMETGAMRMNQRLQQLLNPPGTAEFHMGQTVLRVGDKVMQMKNNYDIPWVKDDGEEGSGIFNGDIGILLSADRSGNLSVRFDDRVAQYADMDAQDLELAYAVTVHKSQGSEYECVVMPVIGAPPQLTYRNLLYTAVTRAKKLLVLVGTAHAVEQMVRNDRRTLRYTSLCRLIEEMVGE